MTAAFDVCLLAPAVPPRVGGVEVFLGTLAEELSRAGWRILLVCGNEPTPGLRAEVEGAGGAIEVLDEDAPPDVVRWEFDTFVRAQRLHDVLLESGIRVVHAASHDAALTACIVKAGLPDVKILTAFGEMATQQGGFGHARNVFIHGLGGIDLYLAWSLYYADVARSYGLGEDRIALCYPGVEVDLFAAGSREKGRRLLGLEGDDLLVSCPSRFTPRKGQMDLVRALSLLPANVGPLRIVFTGSTHSGSTDYLNRVRRAVTAAGWDERVTFRLDEPFENLPHIVAASDVVVQPSHEEGLGGAALEAMAAGTATVLTHNRGFDEIAEDGVSSVMARPADPADLARALEQAITSPDLRRRVAQEARRFSHDGFRAADAAARIASLYRRLGAVPNGHSEGVRR